MTDQFRTEITADRTQFDAQMDAAAQKAMDTAQAMQSSWRQSSIGMGQALAESFKGMNAQFDGFKEAMGALRGPLAAAAAVMAAVVGVVGKAVSETAMLSDETARLAHTLGISTEQASGLRLGLQEIGVGTDTYTSMVGKMTTKLRDNEERFNELGIKTRGANGELLTGKEVMDNALQTLLKFKEGTDRNLASTEIFGKGWTEVVEVMRLTPAVIEAAQKKAEDLQLVIGPAGVERAYEYRASMADVGAIFEAFGNRIGQALMPVLTDMGNWFMEIAPAGIELTRGAMAGLAGTVQGFMLGMRIVFNIVASTIYSLIEPIAAAAEAAALAVTGDFSGAGARLSSISANVSANWKRNLEEIEKSAAHTRDELAALLDPNEEQQGSSPKKDEGTEEYKARAKERMQQWEAALAMQRSAFEQMKLDQGSFEKFSISQERDYWQEILNQDDLSKLERAAVSKKFYDAERQVRKEAFDAEMADLKGRLEAQKQGSVERIQIAGEEAAAVGQRYGLLSPEYRKALAEMTKAAQDHAKQMQQLEEIQLQAFRDGQLQRVTLERTNLETMSQLGQITDKQKLARLRELADIEYAIELKSAEEKAALMTQDVVAYQQQLQKIEEMKQKHAVDMAKIDGQIKVESMKVWRDISQSIVDGFSTAVRGVIQGTQTISQAFHNLLQTVALSLVDMGVRTLAQWALNAMIGNTLDKDSAATKISDNAAVAATASMASVAAIPIYGWAMAPEVGGAAFGEAMSYMSGLASAAGGWDIGAGINPVAQLHAQEMVLPSDIANPLRDSLRNGGNGMSGDTNITIQCLDSADLASYLQKNAGTVAKSMQQIARNNTGGS